MTFTISGGVYIDLDCQVSTSYKEINLLTILQPIAVQYASKKLMRQLIIAIQAKNFECEGMSRHVLKLIEDIC